MLPAFTERTCRPKSLEAMENSELVSPQLGEEGLKDLFDFLAGSLSLKLSEKRSVEFSTLITEFEVDRSKVTE